MDPTMQQAVTDPTATQANQDINGLTTEMENTNIAEESTSSTEVPTYDQQFPSLGGGVGGSGLALKKDCNQMRKTSKECMKWE